MSDLISRSELLKTFNNKNVQITFDLPVEEVLGEDVDLDDFSMLVQDAVQAYKKMVIDTIKNQPTAYSVDKVIKELEERADFLKDCTKYGNKNARQQAESYSTMMMYEVADLVDDLIEIVKQGGVSDDVCEWKSASDGEFIQNPHTKRLYSNEPSMKNVYCNTCGKKINVVE